MTGGFYLRFRGMNQGGGSRSVGSPKASVVKTVTPPLTSWTPVLTPAHPRLAKFPTKL